MPAVIAIARAPQKATRRVALPAGAPPAFAPIAPNIAKNNSDAADTPTITPEPAWHQPLGFGGLLPDLFFCSTRVREPRKGREGVAKRPHSASAQAVAQAWRS